jgi:acyl carrier protein
MGPEITEMILEAVRDLAEEINQPGLAQPTRQTRLFGGSGALDSMALVSLIADLEGRIAAKFGRDVVLADERAMSQVRSPFRTVDSLAAHIETLLSEKPKI